MDAALRFLQSLNEAELRDLVIMPLLSRMGYQDVRCIHGTLELGKDIVFSQQDPLARVRHFAVVVKRGPLTGSVSASNSIRAALAQMEQSLDTPFLDPRNGREVNIDGVYLITPHTLSQQSIQACKGALARHGSRVTFVDGPALMGLIMEYQPDFTWSLPKDLPPVVEAISQKLPHRQNKAFVLMPFGGHYDSYYVAIYKPGLEAAGFVVQRADDIFVPQPIIKDIQRAIAQADVILCEMSGRNPNVFYELGLAHAIGKPVILLCDNLSDVPFDLQHIRTIPYDCHTPDWASKLRDAIRKSVFSIDPTEVWPPPLSKECPPG
jgi:hypothetical protein